MNIKSLVASLFLFAAVTSARASEWTNYFIYQADTIGGYMSFEYLRPVTYYECLSFSIENQAYSIMGSLTAYNSVFDCEKLKMEKPCESGCLSVYLKAAKLSNIEKNELIASLLMQGFSVRRIYLKGQEYGVGYSLSDIDMPFFLPVYFEDQSGENTGCIGTLWEMYRIVYEKDLRNSWLNNTIVHEVEKGETLYGIAKRFDITQEDILAYNPVLYSSPLKAGQIITIHMNSERAVKPQKKLLKTGNQESKSIMIYFLLGASVLMNGWFIWKHSVSKQLGEQH
jgi:hypothetical protein